MRSKPICDLFTPPFCPNPECSHHHSTDYRSFVKFGVERTRKSPGFNQRFRCKSCGKIFSRNTFSLDFRKKIVMLGEEVLTCSLSGMSNNSLARKLKISETTVRNRLTFLARQALLFEKEKERPLVINEPVAYDGFETFTYDQYSPCYVNTAVGSNSLYTYSTTFSPLNRKGRMNEFQKNKLANLIRVHGRYPSDAITKSSEYAFKLLKKRAKKVLRLLTDEHLSYAKALKNIAIEEIEHTTINSKAPRTQSNPLFPINHLHMIYRHFFSSQHRETISFQKHEAGLMDKITLMKIQKNFMRTKFTRPSKNDPLSNKKSPAMYVGIADKVMEFSEVFPARRFKSHYPLDEMEENFFERIYEFSRRKIAYR